MGCSASKQTELINESTPKCSVQVREVREKEENTHIGNGHTLSCREESPKNIDDFKKFNKDPESSTVMDIKKLKINFIGLNEETKTQENHNTKKQFIFVNQEVSIKDLMVPEPEFDDEVESASSQEDEQKPKLERLFS